MEESMKLKVVREESVGFNYNYKQLDPLRVN